MLISLLVLTVYCSGLKRRDLTRPVKRALPMTPRVLTKLRSLLETSNRPNLVQWRTVWRAHMEFGLLLRFDDIKRLKVKEKIFK